MISLFFHSSSLCPSPLSYTPPTQASMLYVFLHVSLLHTYLSGAVRSCRRRHDSIITCMFDLSASRSFLLFPCLDEAKNNDRKYAKSNTNTIQIYQPNLFKQIVWKPCHLGEPGNWFREGLFG